MFWGHHSEWPVIEGTMVSWSYDPSAQGWHSSFIPTSLPDPKSFKPDTDTSNNATVNAVIYRHHLPHSKQPPGILKPQWFSIWLAYEFNVMNDEERLVLYRYNHILGQADHLRCCTSQWVASKRILNTISEELHDELNLLLNWSHIILYNQIEFYPACWQYSWTCQASTSWFDNERNL